MANHAYVKTKKRMTPEKITELLRALNKRLFKRKVKIKYENCVGDKAAWGPHVWLLSCSTGKNKWMSRVCWLNSSRSFEMRHGGGGHFSWWIDNAICNEVALQFNGMIRDDAGDEKWPGEVGKYDDFRKYIENVTSHMTKDIIKAYYIQGEMDCTHPDFRWKTGPRIKCKMKTLENGRMQFSYSWRGNKKKHPLVEVW